MSNRRKRGCILVILGLCMVLSALGIHLAQEQQDSIAGENAAVLLEHLALNRSALTAEDLLPESAPEADASRDLTMPEKDYLGYAMIGTLRIPSVGIELPILSTWSDELLNVAPCRYSGSIPGEDMILMGHNYRSHFTPLHRIQEGDQVEFEDVNGILYRYRVDKLETLTGSQGDRLPSEYPLTLFTCTASGQNRLVVRCTLETP